MVDYRKFFDTAFDLLCVVGPSYFVEVNSAWTKTLKYSKEELLSTPWIDFVHPEDKQQSIAWYLANSGHSFVNRFVTKEGRTVWLEWRCHPRRDVEHMYTAVRDISSCKVVERQLGNYVLKLRKKAEELERSNRDLEHFAYVASHDLQTPLRKVKNFTILLRKEFGDSFSDPEAQRYLQFIISGAEKSQDLIDGLLAFSRTGSHLRVQEIDLGEPLEDALSILSEAIREGHAQVSTDPMPKVHCDPVLMTRVFQNLIGNAIKFRHPEREPQVQLRVKKEGAFWEFVVEDNGIGFDPRHAERIFVIFQRLPGVKNGTGLGLALCKKIVERHGGDIRAESTPGVGSRFTFTLPQEYIDAHVSDTDPAASR